MRLPSCWPFQRTNCSISIKASVRYRCEIFSSESAGPIPPTTSPIIGETTYTLKGVMSSTGKGRSWSLFFLERNHIQHWCVGVHYLYSKAEVDDAWRKESFMWEEWIPLIQVSCVYGVDLRTVLQQIARGRIRVRPGNREQLVSRKDVMSLWKSKGE